MQGGAIKFKLWPSQLRILPLFLSAVYIFILKARQLGLTWLTAAYCLWCAIFNQNYEVVVISANEMLAIKFLDRVKFIFDKLPDWMKPHVYKRTTQLMHFGIEEKDTKGNMLINGLNSIIQSLTTTPKGAQSMTVNLLVLDEAALIENIKSIWRSSKPGVDSAQGRIIVISNAIKDGIGWPWFRQNFTKAVRGLAGKIQYLFMSWMDHPNRGPDFITQQKLEGMDDDDISMHYPATVDEAIEALTGSYFGKVLIRHKDFKQGKRGYLEYNDEGGMRFVEKNNGLMEVWEEPDGEGWRNRYCIFSDVAEGLGLSESVAYIFDRAENRFIVKSSSSKIDADLWALELIMLAHWCGDTPMIAPERSGAGQSTIFRLRREKYPRIYRDRKEDRTKKRVGSNYGWTESRDNKRLLSNALRAYLRDSKESVPDGQLIDQCSTYIRHPDGHLGKEDETKKDDCVIAAGGCMILHSTLPDAEQLWDTKDRYIITAIGRNITRMPWGSTGSTRDPWVE